MTELPEEVRRTEPILVHGMRRRPTGEVKHQYSLEKASGTRTQGFLAELDEHLDAVITWARGGYPEAEQAIRLIHTEEMFGDCVEDGDPYPCKTIQILDWLHAQDELSREPEEKN